GQRRPRTSCFTRTMNTDGSFSEIAARAPWPPIHVRITSSRQRKIDKPKLDVPWFGTGRIVAVHQRPCGSTTRWRRLRYSGPPHRDHERRRHEPPATESPRGHIRVHRIAGRLAIDDRA